MKKLSNLVYLFIGLIIISSCEQESIEPELSNESAEIEALIQEYKFLSEAVEEGFDVKSYISSLGDIAPEVNIRARSSEPNDPTSHPPSYGLYVGDCYTDIQDSDGYDLMYMQWDIYDLVDSVCYGDERNMREVERSDNYKRRILRRGMRRLAIRWAVRGYISWSEASQLMSCVRDFNFFWYCYDGPLAKEVQ
jgi:hypothetical protein